MNWPWKKKKLSFAETAKFNWEADTNAELRKKLNELAKQYPTMQEREYRKQLLELFREKGLDINAEQLDIYAAPVFNLALIRPAHGGDIVSKAVRNDSVLRFDGDMVKQVFLHEPAVSLLCFHFFLLLYAMEFL